MPLLLKADEERPAIAAVSEMPEQDGRAGELVKTEEILWVIVLARHHTAEVMEPRRQPTGRIAVICLVSDQMLRMLGGESTVVRGFDHSHLMRRSAFNPNGDRRSMAVRNRRDLGPFAALGLTKVSAPFLALAKESSMYASLRSMRPRACESATRARSNRPSVPPHAHCVKRRWHGWYGANSFRVSFQRAPVRSTYCKPSRTSRSSPRGLPRLPGTLLSPVSSGWTAHRAPVSSRGVSSSAR
jgi:hypothetical protein